MLDKLLPPTKMIDEAKRSSNGRSLIKEILIFVLVFAVSQSLVSIPVTVATVIALFTSEPFMELMEQMTSGSAVEISTDELMSIAMEAMPDWAMVVQLFSTAIATAATIFYCKLIEKRPLSSMGLRKKGLLREYAIGTVIGILLISTCVGICVLTGSMTLKASSFSPIMWVLFLIGFLIQGMSEEVICRGYMMVSVSRRNALWLAVLTNSVVFSLLHLGNPGFGPLPLLNIILFGILESVYVLKRGDLWGACAIHSLWNFFQGNVFGVSVSGTGAGPSPLTAAMTEGHSLLNGGTFGLEGGVVVTLVITVAVVIMLLVPTKKDEVAVAEA